MKSFLKILGVAMFVTFVFSACSKDDDPTDNDFFVGTYNGQISYNGDGDDVANTNGSVTVVKVASGTTYSFKFSNGIPDINNVQFEKQGDNILFNVGGEAGVNYIRIDAGNLDMLYIKDGNTWNADCSR
ncbi:hypothetical protein ABDK00_004065 [Niabella insulamsoli]|uniref:hypothetical protein n=1 Tax=Niabella insulamsoli TaxID=3144874 RepID=UPI0031FCD02E